MAEEASVAVDGRNRKSWSDVWAHFERFVDADGRQRARCNKCHAELLAETKNGTTRLGRHARDTCPGNDKQQQDAGGSHRKRSRSLPLLRESPGISSKLDVKEANADLARMVAFNGHDPSFVEGSYFRSFVGRLNPDFQVPSRDSVRDMCDDILEKARRDFRSEMDHASSNFSLAIDTVKTVDGTALYVACHFIDDEWNLHKMIMDQYGVATRRDFPKLVSNMYEYHLEDEDECSDVAGCIDDLDLLDKSFSLTVGKNGNLMDCLVLQKDSGVVHKSTFLNVVLHSIAQGLFDNLKPEFHLHVCIDMNMASVYMTSQEIEEFLSQLDMDKLRPYETQWYLCYCCVQFLPHKSNDEVSEFNELLTKLWGEIYRAIKTVSDPRFPTSHLGLVELFKIRDLLQSELTRASGDTTPTYKFSRFEKDVKHVLELAKDELDRSIEDSYRLWSLPLVLDPRYKLGYIEFKFPKVFGTAAVAENNISKVKEFLGETFGDYDEDDETTDGDPSHVTPLDQAWYEQCWLEDSVTGVGGTELDRYLTDPLVPPTDNFNILDWWKVNSSNYPKVACMARDALAIPTSNTLSSEQVSMIRSGINSDTHKSMGLFIEFV